MRRVTRKELSKECKRILKSSDLTEEAKIAAIEQEVECYIDDLCAIGSGDPETSAWERKDKALMEKYYPKQTICCPGCGDFYPKRPPEVDSHDAEYDAIRDRRAAELVRKVLGREAA
jgi:hypothetical protein